MFLFRLHSIIGILQTRFERDLFVRGHGSEATLSTLDSNTVEAVTEALVDPVFPAKCNVLRCVSLALGRKATMLVGFACHEYVLRDRRLGSWDRRVAKYRELRRNCMYKRRRAPQLALDMNGEIDKAGFFYWEPPESCSI